MSSSSSNQKSQDRLFTNDCHDNKNKYQDLITSFISNEKNSLLKRLHKIDTAALCDADKSSSGTLLVMDPYIHLMNSARENSNYANTKKANKMVGIARTVQCTKRNDFLAVLRGLEECVKGEVLIVNTCESDRAVAGGLFITEAMRKGLAGIIIDGPVRDIETLKNSPVPFYAKSYTPYSGSIQSIGNTQINIQCGNIQVCSGDIVVGDDDGVVVGHPSCFENLVDLAEEISEAEERIMKSMLESGRSLHSMTNYEEHLEKRKEGRESALTFRLDD